jgi:hypothetical protein
MANSKRVLAKQYEIESQLFELLFECGFKAFDLQANKGVTIVTFKSPFISNPEVKDRFFERMSLVATVAPQFYSVLKFGIDSKEHGFSILPYLDGSPFVRVGLDFGEAERRFIQALKVVSLFHSQKVAIGTLCSDSLWLDRGGNVRLMSAMGDFSSLMVDPSPINPQLAKIFGLEIEDHFLRDIYALGVIGAKLFTGNYPNSLNQLDLAEAKLPPSWVLTVLPKMLNKEFETVHECLNLIIKLKTTSDTPAVVKTASDRRLAQTQLTLGPSVSTKQTSFKKNPQSDDKKSRTILISAVALVVLSAIIAGVFVYMLVNVSFRSSAALNEKNINESGSPTGSLEQLVSSDDPVAFTTLLSLLKTNNFQEYLALHEAILKRGFRQGFNYTAELIRRWSNKFIDNQQVLPNFKIYELLDKSLPIDMRLQILQDINSLDPTAAKLLAVALCLDLQIDEARSRILNQFFNTLSLTKAIVQDRDLLIEFGDTLEDFEGFTQTELKQIIRNFVSWGLDAEVSLPLRKLAEISDDFIDKIIASEMQRDYPEVLKLFLSKLLTKEVDLNLLSNFRNPFIFDAVLVAVLISEGDELLARLFSILKQSPKPKDLVGEAFSLIEQKWNSINPSCLKILGLIKFFDKIPRNIQKEIINSNRSLIKADRKIFSLLMQIENQDFCMLVFKEMRTELTISQLINLLGHPFAEVRIAVIESLKGVKDLGGMKLILDFYRKEKNPDVKAMYEREFWFIRERVN